MKVFIVLFLLVSVKADNICDKLIYDSLKVIDKIRNDNTAGMCKRYALCGSDETGYEKKCVSWDNTNFHRSEFYKELPSPETVNAVCPDKQQEIYYIAFDKLFMYKIEQGKTRDKIALELWLDWDKSRKCKD